MIEPARFAVDTNILVYADGQNGAVKQTQALDLLEGLTARKLILPAQAMGEFYNVFTRKFRMPLVDVRKKIGMLRSQFEVVAAGEATFAEALDLAATHNLQFWDALILATAADARCSLLLSEDFQDGFVYRGCTVADPFRETLHPLLKDALERATPR